MSEGEGEVVVVVGKPSSEVWSVEAVEEVRRGEGVNFGGWKAEEPG